MTTRSERQRPLCSPSTIPKIEICSGNHDVSVHSWRGLSTTSSNAICRTVVPIIFGLKLMIFNGCNKRYLSTFCFGEYAGYSMLVVIVDVVGKMRFESVSPWFGSWVADFLLLYVSRFLAQMVEPKRSLRTRIVKSVSTEIVVLTYYCLKERHIFYRALMERSLGSPTLSAKLSISKLALSTKVQSADRQSISNDNTTGIDHICMSKAIVSFRPTRFSAKWFDSFYFVFLTHWRAADSKKKPTETLNEINKLFQETNGARFQSCIRRPLHGSWMQPVKKPNYHNRLKIPNFWNCRCLLDFSQP